MYRLGIQLRILVLVWASMFGACNFQAWSEDQDGYAMTTNDLYWVDGFGYELSGNYAYLRMAPMDKLRVVVPEKVVKNGKTYIVKEICSSVFMEWDHVNGIPTNPMIREIVLPNTITKIGDYAFSNQKRLNSINIPKGVKEIGRGVFEKCSSLESIVLPDSLEIISDGLFEWCKNLRSVYIPSNVKKIREYAFAGCNNLDRIILPEGIERIEMRTFQGCKSLKSIVIPSTVRRICKWTFLGCDNLETMIFLNPETMIHPEAFNDEAVMELVNWSGNLDPKIEDEGYYLVDGKEQVFYHSRAASYFGSEEEADKHYVREYDYRNRR